MQTDKDLQEKNKNLKAKKNQEELQKVNMTAMVKKMLLKNRDKQIKKLKTEFSELQELKNLIQIQSNKYRNKVSKKELIISKMEYELEQLKK